jgi:hypothetical protein
MEVEPGSIKKPEHRPGFISGATGNQPDQNTGVIASNGGFISS